MKPGGDRPSQSPGNRADGHSGNPRRPEIDRLLEEHLPALTAFVRLRLGPVIRANESCGDIVQSACREILAHADRFKFTGEERFRAWLFMTAVRKLTDRKRYWLAEKRRPQVAQDALRTDHPTSADVADCYRSAFTSPSGAAIRKEDAEALERAFDTLSPADREVVALARIAGLPHAEIARATGTTPGAVRVRLSRALAKLAAALGKPPRGRPV